MQQVDSFEGFIMLPRREFLKASSLVGFGATLPSFLARTANAAPNSEQPGSKESILVVVQLTGGNDGLNTLIPFKDETYYKLRPSIQVPKNEVLKVNDSLGLHPAMTGMSKLLNDGKMAIIQGVGYPNPSQSHFRSMDIWNAASTEELLTEGWLGKALKQRQAMSFHLGGENEAAPLAFSGAPARVPSIRSLEQFKLQLGIGPDRTEREKTLQGLNQNGSRTGLLDFVQRTAVNTYSSSKRLESLAANYEPKAPYPATELGEKLKLAARLIDSGLGARIFYVSLDGFDTHANQGGATGAHANLWRNVSDSISAFYTDMEKRGQGERVLVMTFSEFGRRAGENGSKGTDHGSGAPLFLVGGKVKSGLHGEHPSLTNLEDGNLKHSIDFRQIYATVLDRWLGVKSNSIVGEGFPAIQCLS
jgi:uncharacterized protein (DUF1501 family)